MEKEKNESEPKTNGFDETNENDPDTEEDDGDKSSSEALKSAVNEKTEDVFKENETEKAESDTKTSVSTPVKEDIKEEDVNEDVVKEQTAEVTEDAVDVAAEQEQKNGKVQLTRKMSTSSNKSSRSDSGGVKNGDTSKVTSTKDKTQVTEEKKVPVSISQSSHPSQTTTSITASRNNSSGTPSTVSSTRSTRSQNPEFLARHRNFLQKLHLTSSTIADEDLLTDDDESSTSKTTSRSSGSVQNEDNSSSGVDGTAARRKRERSASNGTLSPRIPSPSVANNVGGSASANNSDSSSTTASQLQPATKKRRSTRTDSTGTQQQSPVPAPTSVLEATADRYCWLCHKDGVVINCETCPRVYHLRCIQLDTAPTEDWVCPECITILHAENTDTRSRAMKLLSLDQLCNLLKYAVSRMKTYSGAEPFWKAVDVIEFSQYREYVAHPMDLSLLERNIKKRLYGSTEAFLCDTKWILHNCIIFNTYQSRLTGVAKMLVKICKQEMAEIENCPDCYLNAHTRKDSWFIEVCRKPHVLVWAKLKGFPFWPAKVMRNNKEGMVDVRFFGAHDRAWVPVRECFLYSKAMPASARNKKRNNLDACIQEVEQHTKKLRDKFGGFDHAPFRTHFEPTRMKEQLQMLLPCYNVEGDGEQPVSKRNKINVASYLVRTYQRSHKSETVQERNKMQVSETTETEKSVDTKIKGEKRKLWDRDECSEDDKRTNRSLKKTASGNKVTRRSSSSEESEESDSAVHDRRNGPSTEGTGKSASLIEWSRFEESAAKLSVGVEVDGSDEDKQSSASDERKPRDVQESRDNVLPTYGAKLTEGESGDKTGKMVERSAEVATSEVVKKVLTRPSIADKLQERLLRLEEASDDETSEVVSENTPEEGNSFSEVKVKTEEDSKNSKDCETFTSSVTSKGIDEAEELDTSFERTGELDANEITKNSKDYDSSESESRSESTLNYTDVERDRSQSPVVNRTLFRPERKCYGKPYSELGRDRSRSPVRSKSLHKVQNKYKTKQFTDLGRDRQQSTAINKLPLKGDPKRYGRQYSPKVVLYNMVLPGDKLFSEKTKVVNSEQKSCKKKEKHLLSPMKHVHKEEKLHTEEQKSPLGEGTTTLVENILKNGLETSDNHKTDTSHDSESSSHQVDVAKETNSINPEQESCPLPQIPNSNDTEAEILNGVENEAAARGDVDASESGDSEVGMDSSKRTPEHGYSRLSTDDNLLEDNVQQLEYSKVHNDQTNAELGRDEEENGDQREEEEEKVREQKLKEEEQKVSEEEQKVTEEEHKGMKGEEKVADEQTLGEKVMEDKNEDANKQEEEQMISEKQKTLEQQETPSECIAKGEEKEGEKEEVAQGDIQDPVSDLEPAHTTEDSKAGSMMGTESVSKEVTADESPPPDCGGGESSLNNKTCVISNSDSVSDESDVVNNIPESAKKSFDTETSTEETNIDKSVSSSVDEQVTNKESELMTKTVTCTDRHDSDVTDSVTDSCKNVSDTETAAQSSAVKVYTVKTVKCQDKKIKDCMSELSRAEARLGSDVTITPTNVVVASAQKEVAERTASKTDSSAADCSSIADRKIKEEPIDPDEFENLSSPSSSVLSCAHSSVKSSPECKQNGPLGDRKDVDSDKLSANEDRFGKEKIAVNKKLNVSAMDDKERLASNDSPSSMSDKDGIFPSLFLDPSITITVINDKQSEITDVPTSGKSKVSASEINVNELRASVNLSKDISLTVVGAGYNGHSSSSKDLSSPVTPLDMECDHESDHDDSHSTSINTTSSALIPLTVQSVVAGKNSNSKQKKQRNSSGNESLQARSRARKTFPNKPILPNVKVKSHPELVNGIGTFGGKSLIRRNSSGTNSSSSDSRRNSYGTSAQEIAASLHQSGTETHGETAGGSDNNNNNHGSAMVVLPPMLGNPPTSTTNHIQALRTVNGNIGAPSHMVNGGPDMMSSRMMQPPHNQPHPPGNNARISPAGQGPGATSNSRMPPQLQPRPPGPLLAQHAPSAPSEAGPVSAELNRHAHKLSDFLRSTVEEILRDLSNIGSPDATIKSLQLELEKLQWRHNQEMAEMKHNTDLIVMEMRASMESERQRAVAETIRQCELDKQRAVEETKKKQWCTSCGKEALFYCCWNTSYCDYPCQQRHWPQHMSTCAQNSATQGVEVSGREGGDVVQRTSPHASGGASNHHKSASSQQPQPWLDSIPIFTPATSSIGNLSLPFHGLYKNKRSSPSLTDQGGDEDYDNNNNSYEASQRDGRQEIEQKESIGLGDMSPGSTDGTKMPKKRKRCGRCSGCTFVGNCGQCPPCNSTRTHQVCRQRRCTNLLMETVLGVAGPASKRSRNNAQEPTLNAASVAPNHKVGPADPLESLKQKLQQMVSNGPTGGKPPVGPPQGYGGTVMGQPPRNMGPAVGRMPAQYGGLLPVARPNMQGHHMLPTYAMYPGDPRGAGLAALQQQQRLMGSQFPPRHPHMGFTVRPPHYFL